MIRAHRAALNGAELDEIDSSIVIQGIDEQAGKDSISAVSRYGGTGQRVTNTHRDTLDIMIRFGIDIKKGNMAARNAAMEAVNAWAYRAAKGAWLTISQKENRRIWVRLAQGANMGDPWNWTGTYTITLRAYGLPYWQEENAAVAVTSGTGTSYNTTVTVTGNARTVADMDIVNRSGMEISTMTVYAGESEMVFSGLGLGDGEALSIAHDGEGMLSIRIIETGGSSRSAMNKRSAESANDLYVEPGTNKAGFSTQRGCQMMMSIRGRYQ